jgi:thiol-disulfide isomerase/thioredoxin
MKNNLLIITSFLIFSISCSFSKEYPKITEDKKTGEPMLIGIISESDMTGKNFSEWYEFQYDAYIPQPEAILNLISKDASALNYSIILGTWCSDSQREVPIMMKVLKEAGVQEENIHLIAVDRDKNANEIKLEHLKITRIPTLIVYDDDTELGRIVEVPDVSVESDLTIILNQKIY